MDPGTEIYRDNRQRSAKGAPPLCAGTDRYLLINVKIGEAEG